MIQRVKQLQHNLKTPTTDLWSGTFTGTFDSKLIILG